MENETTFNTPLESPHDRSSPMTNQDEAKSEKDSVCPDCGKRHPPEIQREAKSKENSEEDPVCPDCGLRHPNYKSTMGNIFQLTSLANGMVLMLKFPSTTTPEQPEPRPKIELPPEMAVIWDQLNAESPSTVTVPIPQSLDAQATELFRLYNKLIHVFDEIRNYSTSLYTVWEKESSKEQDLYHQIISRLVLDVINSYQTIALSQNPGIIGEIKNNYGSFEGALKNMSQVEVIQMKLMMALSSSTRM